MEENIDERELARAPLRAHILASINPFAGSAAPPATSSSTLKDRPRRHRSSRKRRDSEDRGERRTADEATGDDDERLRPRKSKIRFKSRREKSSRYGEEDEERRRYRSREYEEGSDGGYREGRHTRDDVRDDNMSSREDGQRRRSRSRSGSQTRSTSPRDDQQHRSRRDENDNGEERSHRSHRSHRSDRSHRSHRPRRSHHSSHRHRRRDEEAEPEDPNADPPLDEDAAFRQSLFDAMADDEGAAFWEGVYGQPVHEYAEEASKFRAADASTNNPNDPAGLSAMTDDEYAAYVRLRMWERSDEGRRQAAQKAADERKARAKDDEREQANARERARQKQKAKKADAEYWAEVDRSLKRGQARRQRKQWQEQWQTYAAAWQTWEKQPTVDTIPWPAEDKEDKGESDDFRNEVRLFFVGDDEPKEKSLQTRLRDERVRWHPDKMQQKLGGSVDAEAMRRITAIFQVVDKLWGELKR